jgi:hypothetical protein
MGNDVSTFSDESETDLSSTKRYQDNSFSRMLRDANSRVENNPRQGMIQEQRRCVESNDTNPLKYIFMNYNKDTEIDRIMEENNEEMAEYARRKHDELVRYNKKSMSKSQQISAASWLPDADATNFSNLFKKKNEFEDQFEDDSETSEFPFIALYTAPKMKEFFRLYDDCPQDHKCTGNCICIQHQLNNFMSGGGKMLTTDEYEYEFSDKKKKLNYLKGGTAPTNLHDDKNNTTTTEESDSESNGESSSDENIINVSKVSASPKQHSEKNKKKDEKKDEKKKDDKGKKISDKSDSDDSDEILNDSEGDDDFFEEDDEDMDSGESGIKMPDSNNNTSVEKYDFTDLNTSEIKKWHEKMFENGTSSSENTTSSKKSDNESSERSLGGHNIHNNSDELYDNAYEKSKVKGESGNFNVESDELYDNAYKKAHSQTDKSKFRAESGYYNDNSSEKNYIKTHMKRNPKYMH